MIKFNNDIKEFSHFSTQCLRPRIIRTRDGALLKVPCGHCKSCQLNKASRMSIMCTTHTSSHRFNLFLTLTYDPKHLPRFVFRRVFDSVLNVPCYNLVADCPRDRLQYGKVLSSFSQDYLTKRGMTIDDLLYKFHNEQGYLSLYDYQTFLKRLRRIIDYEYKQQFPNYKGKTCPYKFTYFGCGEYGPVHFRPHYHFIISFEDSWLLYNFDNCVRKAWRFGKLDWSLSRGYSEEYTAGYVNSMAFVPPFMLNKSLRPFCSHSVRYSWSRFHACEKDIKEKISLIRMSYPRFPMLGDFVPEFSLATPRGDITVRPSSHQLGSVFIKCRGFSQFTPLQRIQCYSVFYHAKAFFGTSEIKYIVDTLSGSVADDFAFSRNYHWTCIRRVLTEDDDCLFWLPVETIRNMLYTSSRVYNYLEKIGLDPSSYGSYKYYEDIVSIFYSFRNYYDLVGFFRDSVVYSATFPDVYKYAPQYIYNNLSSYSVSRDGYIDMTDEDFYSHMEYFYDNIYHKAIKHRELNALNFNFL